jgi:Raf kinase inhibitor-like YbhB/YbcL family protein
MRSRLVLLPLSLSLVLGACRHDGRTLKPARPDETQSIVDPTTTLKALPTAPFTVLVKWSSDGTTIDRGHTCDGENQAPQVAWTGVPSATAEVALAVVDEDANGYVHWVVGGLPAVDGSLQAGALPPNAVEGTNGSGSVGWTGPCPPPGTTHHYHLTLYALDQEIGLGGHDGGAATISAFADHAIARAEATATYSR